jgi:hypothetical protein
MGIQSFIIFDKRKPIAPMAQKFRQILREKRNLAIAVNDNRVELGSARSLSVH